MIDQPTKQQIHTFFDVINHLANHENNTFVATGQSIFPGLPRPIPEVTLCMRWLDELINEPDPKNVRVHPAAGIKYIGTEPAPVPEKKIPWNKGKKKEAAAPKPRATAKKSLAKVVAAPQPQAVPTPEELSVTVLKPGPAFEYANEVAGAVLIIPDDPTILSNPK